MEFLRNGVCLLLWVVVAPFVGFRLAARIMESDHPLWWALVAGQVACASVIILPLIISRAWSMYRRRS